MLINFYYVLWIGIILIQKDQRDIAIFVKDVEINDDSEE